MAENQNPTEEQIVEAPQAEISSTEQIEAPATEAVAGASRTNRRG